MNCLKGFATLSSGKINLISLAKTVRPKSISIAQSSTASVKFGSSQRDYLKTVYPNVNIEMKSESGSFELLKIINKDSNGSLSGAITEDGKISLSYRISGTEIF